MASRGRNHSGGDVTVARGGVSEHEIERLRRDPDAFVAYVDAAIRATAPERAAVHQLGPPEVRPGEHRWAVEIDVASDDILTHDFRVVAVLAPPAVIVLHGNTDAGALGRPVVRSGSFIDLDDIAVFGLEYCLDHAFQKPPNTYGFT